MIINWTRKAKFVIAIYLVGCFLIVYLGDFVFAAKFAFLPSVLVGVIAIFGGFHLAWWLIESNKVARYLERKKRVLSALKIFKNTLLTWLFEYASILSADYKLFQESERIANMDYRKYKGHIPQLEAIFGIGSFDKNGKRLLGTDTFDEKKFWDIPISTQSLYHSLNNGLRMTELIENRIKEFYLLEEVDQEIAPIIHLSQGIRSRIRALQEWENKYGKESTYVMRGSAHQDLEQKSNLRKLGHSALDIAIAIDANIDKLEAELKQYGQKTV